MTVFRIEKNKGYTPFIRMSAAAMCSASGLSSIFTQSRPVSS